MHTHYIYEGCSKISKFLPEKKDMADLCFLLQHTGTSCEVRKTRSDFSSFIRSGSLLPPKKGSVIHFFVGETLFFELCSIYK